MTLDNMSIPERLVRVETRLDGVEKNYPTKADLHEIIWRLAALVFAVGAGVAGTFLSLR